jgi:hypothetical protein
MFGEGYYKDKQDEVIAKSDKNLPVWAKDFKDFLQKADKNERANGRSYRSVVVAIPREAITKEDKEKWVNEFLDDLLGDKCAYGWSIHNDKDNHNPHLHLSFSERGLGEGLDDKGYFTRKNPKDRDFNNREWLVKSKETYLSHIKKLAPDYKPEMLGELKIGPELKNAGTNYKALRDNKQIQVKELREARTEFKDLELQISVEKNNIQKQKTTFDRDAILSEVLAHQNAKAKVKEQAKPSTTTAAPSPFNREMTPKPPDPLRMAIKATLKEQNAQTKLNNMKQAQDPTKVAEMVRIKREADRAKHDAEQSRQLAQANKWHKVLDEDTARFKAEEKKSEPANSKQDNAKVYEAAEQALKQSSEAINKAKKLITPFDKPNKPTPWNS